MNSSNKGSSFERKICKSLSLWFSQGERDDLFWRSSQSGGRAKTRSKFSKKTFGAYGDITSTHPDSLPMTQYTIIECKNGYGSWSPLDIIDYKMRKNSKQNPSQTFESFISQMNEDKKISGIPHSMLIFKRNSRQESVAVETKVIMAMRSWSGAINFPYLRYRVKEDYMVFSLDSFFEWANPQFYKDMYNGKFTRS